MTLTLDLQTLFKVTVYPLIKGMYEPDWRIPASDNYLSYNSAMTFTCDLEIWFKVTTYPFFKSPLYMKYDQNRANWKVYMF